MWVHRLSEIDPEARTAVCAECGHVGIRQSGRGRWRCKVAARGNPEAYRARKRREKKSPGYVARKRRSAQKARDRDQLGEVCERCGFVPEHRCQLDIHHRNRDRSDSSPENIETLCANCHRLEHAPPQPLATV